MRISLYVLPEASQVIPYATFRGVIAMTLDTAQG